MLLCANILYQFLACFFASRACSIGKRGNRDKPIFFGETRVWGDFFQEHRLWARSGGRISTCALPRQAERSHEKGFCCRGLFTRADNNAVYYYFVGFHAGIFFRGWSFSKNTPCEQRIGNFPSKISFQQINAVCNRGVHKIPRKRKSAGLRKAMRPLNKQIGAVQKI